MKTIHPLRMAMDKVMRAVDSSQHLVITRTGAILSMDTDQLMKARNMDVVKKTVSRKALVKLLENMSIAK